MRRNRVEVADSTVLVTGAARGIGLALARALHSRGARVVMADLNEASVVSAAAQLGERAVATAVDVTDQSSCDSAVAVALRAFGRLDVVIPNAGVPPPNGTMLTADRSAFDRVLDINLHGVVNTTRAALPALVQSRGHVLVIASIYAAFNGVLATPYAMSKAAVEQMGRALRVELAGHGVTAGVAYLGFIDTGLVSEAFVAPGVSNVRRVLPAALTRPRPLDDLSPHLVRAIERRSARVSFPGWVRPFLLARGVVGPVGDFAMSKHPQIRAGVVIAEQDRASRKA